jgi:hypothetical protein
MKTIVMTGPKPAFQTLSKAIQQYADAAYPPGGSECAQSARAALLDTAEKIIEQIDNQKTDVTISRRIKSHIKAAIQYYLQVCTEQDGDLVLEKMRYQLMLNLLDSQPVHDEQWS